MKQTAASFSLNSERTSCVLTKQSRRRRRYRKPPLINPNHHLFGPTTITGRLNQEKRPPISSYSLHNRYSSSKSSHSHRHHTRCSSTACHCSSLSSTNYDDLAYSQPSNHFFDVRYSSNLLQSKPKRFRHHSTTNIHPSPPLKQVNFLPNPHHHSNHCQIETPKRHKQDLNSSPPLRHHIPSGRGDGSYMPKPEDKGEAEVLVNMPKSRKISEEEMVVNLPKSGAIGSTTVRISFDQPAPIANCHSQGNRQFLGSGIDLEARQFLKNFDDTRTPTVFAMSGEFITVNISHPPLAAKTSIPKDGIPRLLSYKSKKTGNILRIDSRVVLPYLCSDSQNRISSEKGYVDGVPPFSANKFYSQQNQDVSSFFWVPALRKRQWVDNENSSPKRHRISLISRRENEFEDDMGLFDPDLSKYHEVDRDEKKSALDPALSISFYDINKNNLSNNNDYSNEVTSSVCDQDELDMVSGNPFFTKVLVVEGNSGGFFYESLDNSVPVMESLKKIDDLINNDVKNSEKFKDSMCGECLEGVGVEVKGGLKEPKEVIEIGGCDDGGTEKVKFSTLLETDFVKITSAVPQRQDMMNGMNRNEKKRQRVVYNSLLIAESSHDSKISKVDH